MTSTASRPGHTLSLPQVVQIWRAESTDLGGLSTHDAMPPSDCRCEALRGCDAQGPDPLRMPATGSPTSLGKTTQADRQARAKDDKCTLEHPVPWPPELQVQVDGGVSEAGGAGCGWVLWGRSRGEDDGTVKWRRMATGSWPLPAYVTAVEAELIGLISALRFLHAAISCGVLTKNNRPGAVDTDYINAKVRPQLWTGHATMQHGYRATGRMRHDAADGEPRDRPAKHARGTTTMATTTLTTTIAGATT